MSEGQIFGGMSLIIGGLWTALMTIVIRYISRLEKREDTRDSQLTSVLTSIEASLRALVDANKSALGILQALQNALLEPAAPPLRRRATRQ